MLVEVLELHKHFGAFHAVRGVSFAFDRGQIFGFIGPNGAGKTTTMRCLASLEEPSDGSCWVDGLHVAQEPERARAMIGWMPDDLPTHRDMTVGDYLDFFARAYGLPRPRRQAALARVTGFTHLGDMVAKPVNGLSKGMKQRVNLARALLHDPPLLIMDEPAAGLDPHARIELRGMLLALKAEGKSMLISSHILSELEELIDGAVIIEQGAVVHTGTLAELAAVSRAQGAGDNAVLVVEALCATEALLAAIAACPEAAGAQVRPCGSGQAELTLPADGPRSARLLAQLVGAGVPVVEFRQGRRGLEKLFLEVTRGRVQ